MWPTSISGRSYGSRLSQYHHNTRTEDPDIIPNDKQNNTSKNNFRVASLADAAQHVAKQHREAREQALRKPYYTDDVIVDKPSTQHPSSTSSHTGNTIVSLHWHKQSQPFANYKVSNPNIKVSELRNMLEDAGILPVRDTVVFICRGQPLSPTQEKLCSLDVFEKYENSYDIFIQFASEVGNENFDSQAVSNRKLDKLRDCILAIVSLTGRQPIRDMYSEFDMSSTEPLDRTRFKRFWNRYDIPRQDKEMWFESIDTLNQIRLVDIASCIPSTIKREFENLDQRGDDDNNDFNKACLDRLLDRIGDLHDNGIRIVAKLSDLERVRGVTFRHRTLDLCGTCDHYQKALGTCTFESTIDFDKYLMSGYPNGIIPFDVLCDRLNKIQCGNVFLKIQLSDFRTIMKKYYTRGGYDGAAIVQDASGQTVEHQRERQQAILDKLRTWSMEQSFGGVALKKLFQKFDLDEKGYIMRSDFERCLRDECHIQASSQDIIDVMRVFACGNKDRLSYANLIAAIERGHERWNDIDRLKRELILNIRDDFVEETDGQIDFKQAFDFFNTRKSSVVSMKDVYNRCKEIADVPLTSEHGARTTILIKSNDNYVSLANLSRLFQSVPGIDNEMSLEGFKRFLNSLDVTSPGHICSKFRKAVRDAWLREDYDYIELYTFLTQDFFRKEDLISPRSPRTIYGTDIDNTSSPGPKITVQSLKRGCEEKFHLSLRKEETCVVVARIPLPRGFHEFMDFVFPELTPTVTDILVKIRSAIRKKSFGGVLIRRIFDKYDRSGSGQLSVSDFMRGLNEMHLDISPSDFQKVLESGALKINQKTQSISLDEFIRFSLQSSSCTSTWSARTPKKSVVHSSQHTKIERRPPADEVASSNTSITRNQPETQARSQANHYLHQTRPF